MPILTNTAIQEAQDFNSPNYTYCYNLIVTTLCVIFFLSLLGLLPLLPVLLPLVALFAVVALATSINMPNLPCFGNYFANATPSTQKATITNAICSYTNNTPSAPAETIIANYDAESIIIDNYYATPSLNRPTSPTKPRLPCFSNYFAQSLDSSLIYTNTTPSAPKLCSLGGS